MKETRGWKKKVVEARGDSAAHAVGHGVSTSLKRRRERIKKRRERFELNESLEEKIYDGPELKGSSRRRKGQLVASVSESVEIEVGDGASASGNKRGRKRARVKPLNQSLEKKKCQGNDSSVEAVARRVRNSAKLAAEDVVCESEKIGVGVEAYGNLKNRLRRGRQRRTMLEKVKSVKERWKKSKGQGNDSSVEAVDLRESKRTKLAEDGVSESEDVEGVGASEVLGSSVKCQESLMCHQCQRNDKGRVVRCKKCMRKRFCIPCLKNWYPNIPEEDIAESCPVCRINCNCKACLRDLPVWHRDLFYPSFDDQIMYSRYLLEQLLPFMKRLNAEQVIERELEAKRHGL